MNRIRHLTSGGKFHLDDIESLRTLQSEVKDSATSVANERSQEQAIHTPDYFQGVGYDVDNLIEENSILRKLLNFPIQEEGVQMY